MDIYARIVGLRSEVAALERQMQQCPHVFGEPSQEQEERQVPIQENRPMGSDYFNPVTVGFKPEYVTVWVRRCQNCGFKQTTQKTAPVVVGSRPVF